MKALKVLSVLLALLLLVFCFAACNEETPAANNGNQSTNQEGNQGGTQGGNQGGTQGGNQGGTQGGNQGGTQGGNQTQCANGHTPGEQIVDKDATCAEAGSWHKSCTVCGAQLESGTLDRLTSHPYGMWVVDKPATLHEQGSKHRTCTSCDEQESAAIPLLTASQGLAYRINRDNTTCTITGLGTCTDADVVIPEKIEKYTVTSIAWGALQSPSFFSVVIPDTVTTISDYAFYGCERLTSVMLGKGLTSIGNGAFERCFALLEVYNTSNLSITQGAAENGYVGYYAKNIYTATQGASKLTTTDEGYRFYQDGEAATLVAYVGNGGALVLPDDCGGLPYAIVDLAFPDGNSVTSLTISKGVNKIAPRAFDGCCAYAEIKLASDNTYYSMVNNCLIDPATKTLVKAFRGFVVPTDGSVTAIGAHAFRNNYDEAMNNLVIPEGVTSIGDYAFYGCEVINSVKLPDSLETLGNNAFENCALLATVDFGDGVISIGDAAFTMCGSLLSVALPDTVKTLGTDAFSWCYSLTSVSLGKGLETIGNYAFGGCGDLVTLEIPTDSVLKVIGEGAFNCCESLSGAITIPDGVTEIAPYLFDSCYQLTSVTLGAGVKTIGEAAFQYTAIESITIPNGVESIGVNAFNECTALKKIVLPDSVKTVESGAFYGCTALRTLVISVGVEKIGQAAFGGCSLSVVYYGGTASDWSNVTVGAYNMPTENLYYYSADSVTGGQYWHWVGDVPTAW